jgi:hypothetical protein
MRAGSWPLGITDLLPTKPKGPGPLTLHNHNWAYDSWSSPFSRRSMIVPLLVPSGPGPGYTERKILIERTGSGRGTIDMTDGIGFPVGEPKWAAELGDAGGTALIIGARSGVGRVELSGSTVDPDEFWQNFEEAAARPLLDLAREGGLEPQGLSLLSEVIATSVAVRIAHGERRLTREEVRDFLPQFVAFLNSFFHGCNPT